MKKAILLLLPALVAAHAWASTTLPVNGQLVRPSDPHIQYVGRIVKTNPDSYRFSYPGTQIIAAFEGTQLKMMCKPRSGYFMVSVDGAEPFKIAFMGERDSVVTLATALPQGRHEVRVMYAIEGYEYRPAFKGFILEQSARLLPAPALPERRIEFIGNSITCGYGNESTDPNDHFEFETENHFFSYAQLSARELQAVPQIVARSGIGVYRNYGGPKTGTPELDMPSQYEYTLYNNKEERWDFSRFTPDVVCINLGTNDLSTNNYDVKLLKKGYEKFLQMVRRNNPQAKIVFLCGSMLQGKELEIARKTLDEIVENAHKQGDKQVYRFDFSPHNGSLKYGADWHPSLWQHRKMAAELTAYLRELMQWF